MEVFVLMGAWDYEGSILLGVYASEDEARNAHGVYTRDGDQFVDRYYIVRQTVGAPVDHDTYRTYIG
jgi:N-formylglutamate amidohydrolase